jgi:hypothetical protein
MARSRRARCCCGRVEVACEGEPVRASVCHCLECQRRTGSVFGAQVRFRADQVSASGEATEFTRSSDSGQAVTFRFCPSCGSTVYWTLASHAEFVVVALGAFADKEFGKPGFSVYESRRHPWVRIDTPVERLG